MAFSLPPPTSITPFVALLAFLLLVRPSNSAGWLSAGATWYGAPTGDGSDINNCGYGPEAARPPYSSMVACGNPLLFNSGKGCGACYQVKCTNNPACSGKPVTLTITDSCLGGVCLNEAAHFDMSGTLFGSMAKPGLEDQLRHAGYLKNIQYRRVPCNYPGYRISFQVQQGSNPWYFAVLPEFEDGDGELSAVEVKPAGSNSWMPMHESWGAVYRLDTSSPLHGPFSIRLTSGSGKTLTANNVIPAAYRGGATYRSLLNYD